MPLMFRLGASLLFCVLLAALVAACPPAPVVLVKAPPPPTAPKTPLPAPRTDGRLPALATPLAYTLAFDLDPRTTSFAGTVRIDVDVPAPTSHVVLHGRSLTITEAHAAVDDQRAVRRSA